MKNYIILLTMFVIPFIGFNQTEITIDDSKVSKKIKCNEVANLGDCSNSFPILAQGRVFIECLPKGHGKLLEFNNNPVGNQYYFEQEHNTLWLRIRIIRDGLFTFKMHTMDSLIDLDFLLFEKFSDDYCMDIITKKIRPIRTNISRPNEEHPKATGLAVDAKSAFAGAGKGDVFSSALEVKKNEEYIIVIDNVTEEKLSTFYLQFHYYEYATLSGTIVDEYTGLPIETVVNWEDAKTGEVLQTVTSNKHTGKFEIKVPYELNRLDANYSLTATKKGYFFIEQTVSSNAVKHMVGKPINLMVPQLKKGLFSTIKSVNFYQGEDVLMPKSNTSVKRLVKLMEKNPTLTIRIDGHTDGCSPNYETMQILSDSRSAAIKNYLVQNKIDANRIFTQGFSCSMMLYPNPINDLESELNRRVEVLVLDY